MNELCGLDCCRECALLTGACGGCEKTNGHPCGGTCVAAECVTGRGFDAMEAEKQALIAEFNALGIPDLQIDDLHLLLGSYVNPDFTLPDGTVARLLRDDRVYWGNQVVRPDVDRCYGLAADDAYLLVCEYGYGGSAPQILLYKKRG